MCRSASRPCRVPFLLLLFPALDKVWYPGAEPEVVRVVTALLVGLLGLLVAVRVVGDVPDVVAGAVDVVVPRRQLWGLVTGPRSETC